MEEQRASRLGPQARVALTVEAQDVETQLLAALRERTGDASLSFRARPSRITGGFETVIFTFELEPGHHDLAGPLVVRVFPHGTGAQSRLEAIVHATLARQGYPAPELLLDGSSATLLGAPYLVMRRIKGGPMLDSLLGPRMTRMAAVMGETLGALHALDPAPLRDALTEHGIDVAGYPLEFAEEFVRGPAAGLAPLYDWLIANRPHVGAAVICHGDYHPLNIMVDARRVRGVLDWPNVRLAPAAWDLGGASALFNFAPVSLPGPILPLAKAVRHWLWRRVLRAYARAAPLPDEQTLRYFETLRLFGFLLEVTETRLVARGEIAGQTRASAFEDARALREILARAYQTTGTRPTLPPPP